jgi:hypothetical protein
MFGLRNSVREIPDQTESVPAVIVQRRQDARSDRIYVEIDGEDIGYLDLSSGEVCCERPLFTPAVARATAAMTGGRLQPNVRQYVQHRPRPITAAPSPIRSLNRSV